MCKLWLRVHCSNVAQFCVMKLLEEGATVLAMVSTNYSLNRWHQCHTWLGRIGQQAS